MGLEKALADLNNEIFVRTQLGAQEVSNVSGSVLPREARTLLILIDGRKSYAQVTRLLENRKMFRSAGGLKRHLQMLVDLDYIKLSKEDLSASNDSFLEIQSEHCEITLFTKASDEGSSVNQDSPEPVAAKAKTQRSETKPIETQSIDQLRSITAVLIAKHDDPEVVKRYSQALAKCETMHAIFDLIQAIAAESTGQFKSSLKMAAKAFKSSKID